MRIVLSGGGTGGHLIPLVAVARKIKEIDPESEFIFIGPDGKMEKEVFEKEGIPMINITAGKMRRYFSWLNFLDFFKIPIGFFQSLFWLLRYMPDAVFSKGGYASVPVVLVAWLYRIPVMIHESDSNPGMANSALAKFAKRVAISYPRAEKYFPAERVVLTGVPLREDIAQGNPEKAKETFSLADSKKVIFVWGGSQGAKSINQKLVRILPKLLKKYQVIHQTGELNFTEVKRMAGELGIKAGREGYYPLPYIDSELKDILAVSDLVISRAGASSIAEIAATEKPAIIVPLETSANDHQRMNAYSLSEIGACLVLEENNLGENMFLSKIDELMDNQELRSKMVKNIKVFYHPEATEKIARGILGMIKK